MIHIVYCSPAGSTKTVGEAIAEEARRQGAQVQTWDASTGRSNPAEVVLKSGDCLFVGSPVYAQHPLPGVLDFINGVQAGEGASAAAFVTYGMVSSGVALSDMAQALTGKGLGVLGGIKVPAVHSMLRAEASPVGAGRPSAEDLNQVKAFAREVLGRAKDNAAALPVDAFEQPIEKIRKAAADSGVHKLKGMMPPMELDQEACTQCGVCVDECPTQNISLNPHPVLGDNCIMCFNCVYSCPEEAMKNQAQPMLGGVIQERKEAFGEPGEVRAIL